MAWLDATSEKVKRPRRETLPEGSPARLMPPLEFDEGLVQYFYETGRYGFGPNGVVPLTWQELNSYLTATGYKLSNWEKHALKVMSASYVAEYYDAREPSAPSPVKAVTNPTREDVSNQLKNVLRAIGKRS